MAEVAPSRTALSPADDSLDRSTDDFSEAPLRTRPSEETVTALITANLPLVGHLVREALAKVPSHVSADELSSAGMMALVVSAQNFDDSRGVPFARFAAIRIRGAIIDELRGMDWAARSVRGRAREADAVRSQCAAALGRTPRPEEIAAAMGISLTELQALDADLARAGVVSIDGFAPETGRTVDLRLLRRPGSNAADPRAARLPARRHRRAARAAATGRDGLLLPGAADARHRRGTRSDRVARLPDAGRSHSLDARRDLHPVPAAPTGCGRTRAGTRGRVAGGLLQCGRRAQHPQARDWP